MPDNNSYVIAAYAVTWVMLLAYAVRLHRVARRAETQFAEASRGDDAAQ